MERRVWQAPWGRKESDMSEQLHFHFTEFIIINFQNECFIGNIFGNSNILLLALILILGNLPKII